MKKLEAKEDLSYSTYLQLEKLLHLQKLQSPGVHDELLFIVIHQVYELWFKQIIHELIILKKYISENSHYQIISKLKRVRQILKVIVSQTDILETMGPLSFLSFRDYLGTASGFQSYQFRYLMLLLGIKKETYTPPSFFTTKEQEKLLRRYKEASIWENFLTFFKNKVRDIPSNSLPDQDLNEQHKLLLHIYRNPSIYTEICELIIDIDEGIQEWRYRHVKMVERTIGDQTKGTGGSSGVSYLKRTISTTFCPELWEIRKLF